MVLLLALTLITPHTRGGKRALPRWLHTLFAGDTEALFLGLLLGPAALGLFDRSLLDPMRPFLIIGLGWVGLIFGIQWEMRKVRRFPRAQFLFSASQALVTFALVTLLMALALLGDLGTGEKLIIGAPWRHRILLAGLLGALACITSPIGIGWLMVHRGARGANTRLAEFVSATDGVVGVLLFGLVLSAFQPTSLIAVPGLRALSNFAFALALGVVLGWVAHFILQTRWSDPEYTLWLIGLVAFSSGAAHAVHQSPLVVNFVMGVVFVNLSHQSERVTRSLGDAERPLYLLFLVLAGAGWSLHFSWAWLLIVPYVIARLLGKLGGVALAGRLWRLDFTPQRRFGLTLLGQGGLALAMIVNVWMLLPEAAGLPALESLVILSIVFNQMTAPAMAEGPLRRAGEIPESESQTG